jgi:hypothetical protein
MSLIGTYGGEDDVRLAQARITANQAGALVGGGSSGDATVTVNVGQTTTIAPGTPASVTNSGTDTDAVFNFNIPAGFNGAKGEQGEQGIQGIQGEQGIPGAKGDPGEPGIQGVKGDQGDPGANGLDGAPGANGANGLDAVQGRTLYSWTGSQAVNSNTALNLCTLVTKGVDDIGTSIAAGTIKMASKGDVHKQLAIRVRVTGTMSGSTGTDRFFEILLRRPEVTQTAAGVIDSQNLVKKSGSNAANNSVNFISWYKGATDKYVTDGWQVWLANGDDGTLTLTSVDFTLQA